MKKIIYSMAAGLLVSAGLASCSSEEPVPGGNNNGEIQLAMAPKVIAYSGSTSNLFSPTSSSRAANVNGNMWYQDWDRPSNVTDEEIAKVLEAVKEPRVNAVNDITIEWENFWVQQVYKGQTEYSDHYDNNRGLGSNLMNELSVWNDNAQVWYPNPGFGAYEHVNNFNSGDNKTTHTDGENGYVYEGTTLMTGIGSEQADPTRQFAYKNSADGGQYYYDYIVIEIDGEYYVCFDFFADNRDNPTATANKDHYIDRDWVFNDWIVKISPAYPKGTTPENPGNGETTDPTDPTPGENTCPNCGHEHNGDVCDECQEDGPCFHGDTGNTPGDDDNQGNDNTPNVKHGQNEVEVNLTPSQRNDGSLESHLSIHVRHATDVEIFIPVPVDYYCDTDDMAIVQIHDKNHMVHDGPYKTTFELKDKEDGPYNVSLYVEYLEDGIRIWTEGINQDVIDFCYKHYNDGITFEVWNYFNESIDMETLKGYLNQATVKFLDDLPDAYINAFNEENGTKNDDDCTVSIVDEQRDQFNDPTEGEHLNGSHFNQIYENKTPSEQ